MKKYISTLLISLLLVNCVSTRQRVAKAQPYTQEINWPEVYKPEKANFFVHNEIDISASPENVWTILIQAETWPNWYKGAKNVQVINNDDKKLSTKTSFSWKTMGINFTSNIKEFQPYTRLSWESKKSLIKGYHAWLIILTDDGCKVVTQESQYGFLTFLQKVFMPNKLRKLHDVWLLELKTKAEALNNEFEN